MNQYISIYRKDYTWPHASTVCKPRPLTNKDASCICIDSRLSLKKIDTNKYFDWNRTGSNEKRLLDPKLHSIKVGPISEETDKTHFNQLWVCLRNLEDRYFSDKTLRKSFLSEIIARENADHMKTTYQIDYSDPAAARLTQRDKALTSIKIDGENLQYCVPIEIIIATDCRRHCRFSRYNGNINIRRHDHKRKNELKCEKKRKDAEGEQMRLLSWRSEYQDTINKIGQTIMKPKLHCAKKQTIPVWFTSQ